MKFRMQFSDDVLERTVECPKGDYKVCLEGYFDFNEALMKLMVQNGDMLPRSSQFEPGSDDDDDGDFTEPQFDDVCDALEESRRINGRFQEALKASLDSSQGNGEGKPSPKPPKEPVDPVSEVTE